MSSKSLEMKEFEGEVLPYFRAAGFLYFGWFRVDERTVGLLVGNAGSDIWEPFSTSSFANDGQGDPLNRWTRSVVDPVAKMTGAEVAYPFGDKVWPFQQWAMQAMGLKQSPLGLLMHPRYGLWFAFRAALLIENDDWQGEVRDIGHACDTCVEKPCLNSCPVKAVSAKKFYVGRCRDHLNSEAGRGCVTLGCVARRACPVGRPYIYEPDHQAFHMAALN